MGSPLTFHRNERGSQLIEWGSLALGVAVLCVVAVMGIGYLTQANFCSYLIGNADLNNYFWMDTDASLITECSDVMFEVGF